MSYIDQTPTAEHSDVYVLREKKTRCIELAFALLQNCCKRGQPLTSHDQKAWADAVAEELYPGEGITVSRQAIDKYFQSAFSNLKKSIARLEITDTHWNELRQCSEDRLAEGVTEQTESVLSHSQLRSVYHACNKWLADRGLEYDFYTGKATNRRVYE